MKKRGSARIVLELRDVRVDDCIERCKQLFVDFEKMIHDLQTLEGRIDRLDAYTAARAPRRKEKPDAT